MGIQTEKESISKAHSDLKESVDLIKNQLAEAQEKITSFEAEKNAEKIIACFNERMDVIDQKYALEDDDRAFLAGELKTIDTEEQSFASFKEKLSILWKSKDKETKAAFEAQVQARIDAEVEKRMNKVSTASVEDKEESIENILDNVESSEAGICNSNETVSREQVSLRDKFTSAFKRENIIISQ